MAEDLQQGREHHALDNETLRSVGTSLLFRSPLFVSEDRDMGLCAKETCGLLSHAEVVAKYKTTTRSLRLLAFKLRMYSLVKGVEFEYLCPYATGQPEEAVGVARPSCRLVQQGDATAAVQLFRSAS